MFTIENIETAAELPIGPSEDIITTIHSIRDLDNLIQYCIDQRMEEWGTEMVNLINQSLTDSNFPLETVIRSTIGNSSQRLSTIAVNLGLDVTL